MALSSYNVGAIAPVSDLARARAFYDPLMQLIAARTPAGSNGVIYTPWIYGERAPVEDSTLRAAIYNLSLHNSRADIIRAFLEGVAFNTRWVKPLISRQSSASSNSRRVPAKY